VSQRRVFCAFKKELNRHSKKACNFTNNKFRYMKVKKIIDICYKCKKPAKFKKINDYRSESNCCGAGFERKIIEVDDK